MGSIIRSAAVYIPLETSRLHLGDDAIWYNDSADECRITYNATFVAGLIVSINRKLVNSSTLTSLFCRDEEPYRGCVD